MSGYELRAEHRPANPGRRVSQWHIVPLAHRLTGLCKRLTEPVADVRPIADVWVVEPHLRCPECWAHYAVDAAEPPAWAGTWLPPSLRRRAVAGGAAPR